MLLIIDLHVHTNPKSPCSSMSPLEAIEQAKKIGLDGICLVEHDVLWTEREIIELCEKTNFKVFRGVEISSLDGHVLAYGYNKLIDPFLEMEEIRDFYKDDNGFLAIAHPFREFLVVGVSQIAASPEEESRKKFFQYVNGIKI